MIIEEQIHLICPKCTYEYFSVLVRMNVNAKPLISAKIPNANVIIYYLKCDPFQG